MYYGRRAISETITRKKHLNTEPNIECFGVPGGFQDKSCVIITAPPIFLSNSEIGM